MKLTILLAGNNPEPLRAEFGQYAQKFVNMLGAVSPEFTFDEIAVYARQEIPEPQDMEGVIITGSAAGVYETPPWMNPLRVFIRKAYAANLPMLGICFGHQIMADALGGEVVKSHKGWSIGRHVYRLNACPAYFLPGNDKLNKELAIAASHQDQVITAPDNSTVFLSSDFTPNAGLIYDNGKALSLQPHPEFEIDYSAAIFELRRNNPLDGQAVDLAVKSLEQPLDNTRVAKALARFFLETRMPNQ